MKTIFTLLINLAFFYNCKAQGDLYGTIYNGGEYGLGAVYKTDSNGLNYQIVHDFKIDGQVYDTYKQKLIEINGKMYGVGVPFNKSFGSDTGFVIFSYNLTTKQYKSTWIHQSLLCRRWRASKRRFRIMSKN